MATTTATPSALFQALRSANVDAELAHRAALESRSQAGDNVIEIIGAQLSEFRSEVGAQLSEFRSELSEFRSEVNARFDSVNARFDSVNARFDSVNARIDSVEHTVEHLRQVIWRVIWPLLIFLGVPIFSLLYKVLTS